MKKKIIELEEDLKKLKEREAKLKDELHMQKKATDAKAKKERAHKMFQLAEVLVTVLGEEILDNREAVESFALKYKGRTADIP